jgi:biopolymer transport protein ExbD
VSKKNSEPARLPFLAIDIIGNATFRNEASSMSQANLWRVRPAESTGPGRQVSWSRLSTAIGREEVGDLDEVLGPGESQWQTVGEHPIAALEMPSGRRNTLRIHEEADSDMTPMIDVTFQLLIFFMIAATYTLQKTLDLPSNQADDGAATVTMEELEKENIVVKIAGDGAVVIQDKAVPLADVEREIRAAVGRMKSAELVLDVDDRALHDVVVQVIDAAAAAQIEKVLFVSREKQSNAP